MFLLFHLSIALAMQWDIPLLKLENQATEIKKESALIKETVQNIKKSHRIEKIPEILYSIQKLEKKIQKNEEIFKNIKID